VRAAVTVLRDEDVAAVLENALVKRLVEQPWGPPLGRLLGQLLTDGAHHKLVDLLTERAYEWVRDNHGAVSRVVSQRLPGWSPRFVDGLVADKLYGEVLAHPEVQILVGSAWGTAKKMLLDAAEDKSSELRRRVRDGLVSLGGRLSEDPELRSKVDNWLQGVASYVVANYRGEIITLITDTVQRWDAEETSRKVELQVGRDLQFIRINGTVVGALAGLAIHTVAQLLL
jgi:uncharacterized membrane-anchored protein YjiN (DUF445 family)